MQYIISDLNNDHVEVWFEGTEYVPAKTSGHPDTWCEAEGGEIEIDRVMYKGVDISLIISDDDWTRFEQECFDYKGDDE